MTRVWRWLTHAPVVRPLPGLRTSEYHAQQQRDAAKAHEAAAHIAELRARLAALELTALRDAHERSHDLDS